MKKSLAALLAFKIFCIVLESPTNSIPGMAKAQKNKNNKSNSKLASLHKTDDDERNTTSPNGAENSTPTSHR